MIKARRHRRITNLYNYDKMTLKNAVTKGVKAWRDRRVGYWLCIDPKTGEYYLLTSANLAELNGLKAMYRLPAVYYRAVLTRDWNVKLGPHVIGTHLDTSAYIKDLDGFFDRIEAKNKVELRKAIKKRLSLGNRSVGVGSMPRLTRRGNPTMRSRPTTAARWRRSVLPSESR